jgi:hypothetical protein
MIFHQKKSGFQESLTKGNVIIKKKIKQCQSIDDHLCKSCMVFRHLLPFYDLLIFFGQKISSFLRRECNVLRKTHNNSCWTPGVSPCLWQLIRFSPKLVLWVPFYEDNVMPFLLDLLISCLQNYPKKI